MHPDSHPLIGGNATLDVKQQRRLAAVFTSIVSEGRTRLVSANEPGVKTRHLLVVANPIVARHALETATAARGKRDRHAVPFPPPRHGQSDRSLMSRIPVSAILGAAIAGLPLLFF